MKNIRTEGHVSGTSIEMDNDSSRGVVAVLGLSPTMKILIDMEPWQVEQIKLGGKVEIELKFHDTKG